MNEVKTTQKQRKSVINDDKYYAKATKKKAGGKHFTSQEINATRSRKGKTVAVIPANVTGMIIVPKKRGQPTKYRKEYCDLIIRYFTEAEPVVKVVDDPGGKGGTSTHYETVRIPSVLGFAARIGVNQDTLYEWSDKHPEFSEAFMRARALQDAIIFELGMAGRLGKGLAEMYFTNKLGFKDSRHLDVTSDGKALPQPITALQLNVNSPSNPALPE